MNLYNKRMLDFLKEAEVLLKKEDKLPMYLHQNILEVLRGGYSFEEYRLAVKLNKKLVSVWVEHTPYSSKIKVTYQGKTDIYEHIGEVAKLLQVEQHKLQWCLENLKRFEVVGYEVEAVQRKRKARAKKTTEKKEEGELQNKN